MGIANIELQKRMPHENDDERVPADSEILYQCMTCTERILGNSAYLCAYEIRDLMPSPAAAVNLMAGCQEIVTANRKTKGKTVPIPRHGIKQ